MESISKVILTFAAKEDLKETKEYITVTLGNPSAANGIIKGITSQLRTLERFPEAGSVILLDESPILYRYLVHGNYTSFYHVQKGSVIIDRILYGRRNYLKLLLVNHWEEDIEVQ